MKLIPLPLKRAIDRLLGLTPFRDRVIATEGRLNDFLDNSLPMIKNNLETLISLQEELVELRVAQQDFSAKLQSHEALIVANASGPFSNNKDFSYDNCLTHDNFQMVRKTISENYIRGSGIEIGALNLPLPVAEGVNVRFVDRETEEQLHDQYDELGMADVDFVDPDVVDDGEELRHFSDNSEDFVIASHVLEHLENPIKAFKNWLRVVKHGGIVYLALPDMRRCFDVGREITNVEHVIRDYEEGPEWSRSMAFQDFGKIYVAHGMDKGLVEHLHGEARTAREKHEAERLNRKNFSIHFHAWTPDAMLEMFLTIKNRYKLSFEIELMLKNQDEVVFIFRKTVPQKIRIEE